MTRAAELRQRAFEAAHLGSKNELAMSENARDRCFDRGSKPAALGRHVDERNWRQICVLVHYNADDNESSARNHARRGPFGCGLRPGMNGKTTGGDLKARHTFLAADRRR